MFLAFAGQAHAQAPESQPASAPAAPTDEEVSKPTSQPAAPQQAAPKPPSSGNELPAPAGGGTPEGGTAVSLLNRFHPYVVVVGGFKFETLQNREDEETDRESRITTIAMSRFGVNADFGNHLYVESEFEVNLGPHGTSVWEGQAALQVRNQFLRLSGWGAEIEGGRITDLASIDYFTPHIADTLLKDALVRESFLASGANLGNGVAARYEILEGLKAQFTFTAANPVSTTGSLVVGGSYYPFGRFYLSPWQQVGRDASRYPSDQFHIMLYTPAVLYKHKYIEAKTSVQFFDVNTNTNTKDDAHIRGYNIRANVMAHLFDDRFSPYANFSHVSNPILDKNDLSQLSGEHFKGWTAGGGLTFNYWKNNGVGANYSFIRDQEGTGMLTQRHYINVGTTFYIWDVVAVAGRFAWFINDEYPVDKPHARFGERSFFLTMRTMLR
jgi:hypothetical protein